LLNIYCSNAGFAYSVVTRADRGRSDLDTHSPAILLIDDSEGIRLLISEILTDAGYRVTAVPDGDAALAAARTQPPDVVITDLSMPGRPVSEIIRVLRHEHPGIRIIILSGLMDEMMSRAILASGVDAAVDKGMATEILVETVARLLRVETPAERLTATSI
jgi:DNA-binding response OmpR family regulator